MNASRRLAAASVAAALAACAHPAARAAPATARPAPPSASAASPSSPDAMALEVGRLVNEHRVRVGCHPLLWDSAAARAAQAHTDDMVRRGYFAHESPEGRNVGNRLHDAGGTWRGVAENIASGQRTAQGVVQSWLDSPGHRQNIENCLYTRQGVGHRANVWTHVFYNVGL